jgi:hypothetical protein
MSIGFRTVKDEWKGRVRLLKEIRLHEISLVTFPAQELATVANVKAETPDSYDAVQECLRSLELGDHEGGKPFAWPFDEMKKSEAKKLRDDVLSSLRTGIDP